MIKLKLWPAAGCVAKVAAELSSRPLQADKKTVPTRKYNDREIALTSVPT